MGTMNTIIGGGVYGAAVAWHLARRGEAVTLLEAATLASGASGGPGRRGVRANYRDPREVPLMVRARKLWPTLHEELGTDPLFERTGHLTLIEREDDLDQAAARVSAQTRLGIPTRLLSAGETRELEPEVSAAVIGAVYCPDDGVADHGSTTRAYARAAEAAGAIIHTNVRVARLEGRDGRVSALTTTTGDEIAVPGRLLVLANAGVRALVAPWIDVPIWNRAFQVLLSKPLAHNPVRHLVGHAHRTLSLKREDGGRLMISGGHQGRWNTETGRGEPIAAEVAANVATAVAVYPSLEGLEIEVADTSHLEAVSLDGVPIIDKLPGNDDVLYATGWCGHGWAIAPAVTEMIAEWTVTRERPALLAPFAASRFG